MADVQVKNLVSLKIENFFLYSRGSKVVTFNEWEQDMVPVIWCLSYGVLCILEI